MLESFRAAELVIASGDVEMGLALLTTEQQQPSNSTGKLVKATGYRLCFGAVYWPLGTDLSQQQTISAVCGFGDK